MDFNSVAYGGDGNDTITGASSVRDGNAAYGGAGDDLFNGQYFRTIETGIGTDRITIDWANWADEVTMDLVMVSDETFSFSTTIITHMAPGLRSIQLFEGAIDDFDDLVQNHLRVEDNQIYVEHENFLLHIEAVSGDDVTMDDFTAPDSVWADVFTF